MTQRTFNPTRLEIARKRRRLTSRALSIESGVSTITLSRIVNVHQDPDKDTIERISRALSYPIEFFYSDEIETVNSDGASFRSLTSMSAIERDAALSSASLAYEISDWVNKSFKLPDPDIIDMSHERDPSKAARIVRQYWSIGERPMGNMVHFLETKGVRIFSLTENTRNVDAFSVWRNGEPFIFLNTYKTAERSRFDAAHELGHLVLHKHGGPKQRSAEQEANQFASSFLMPQADVISNVSNAVSLNRIIQHKKRWGVSAAALLYRLNKLGMLSDWQYRSFVIDLNRDNHESEPEGMARETSHIWRSVLQALWAEGKTIDHIARELLLPPEEVRALLFGLTVSGHDMPNVDKSGALRVVK